MAHVKFRHSIATRLLKLVFGLYLLVTIVVTVAQMYTEYELTRETVLQEIRQLPRTHGPALGNALWTYNTNNLHSLMKGMHASPVVSGIKIEYENTMRAIGTIEESAGKYVNHADDDEPSADKPDPVFSAYISHEFPIMHQNADEDVIVGKGVIYTSTNIVFARVQDGFVLIVLSAVLKTFALWLIFFYFVRKLIGKPLRALASATESVDLNKIDSTPIQLDSKDHDELRVVQDTFNQMLVNLANAKQQLDAYSDKLERRVAERTAELQSEVEARIQAQKDAEKSSELKGMFIANVSHEIRTPMTSIYGMVRLLGASETNQDRRNQLLLIERNCDRLLAIINEILDFAKLESDTASVDMKPLDVRECVHGAVNSIKLLADQKGIQIEVRTQQAPEFLCSDESKLTQVLVNLLSNAIKFTEQGSIHIHVARDEDNDGYVRFSVVDTGIGIPEDKQSELFTEFTQVDGSSSRHHGGTGLGLAISRKYVEKMGGRIWVDSRVGHGSTFTFTLPVGQETDLPESTLHSGTS